MDSQKHDTIETKRISLKAPKYCGIYVSNFHLKNMDQHLGAMWLFYGHQTAQGQPNVNPGIIKTRTGPLSLTWFNFNPNMDITNNYAQ